MAHDPKDPIKLFNKSSILSHRASAEGRQMNTDCFLLKNPNVARSTAPLKITLLVNQQMSPLFEEFC